MSAVGSREPSVSAGAEGWPAEAAAGFPAAAATAAAAAPDLESAPPSPTLIPAVKAAGEVLQLQAWPPHLELQPEAAFNEGSCSLGEQQRTPPRRHRWGRWVGAGMVVAVHG